MRRNLVRHVRRFLRGEQGSITVWSLFLFVTAGAIGAAAVDVTHMFAARTQLQVAADIAAHTALLRRNQSNRNAAQARLDAIAAAQYGMPDASYGDVLDDADILFGTYDAATDTFEVDATSRSAVLVTTSRAEASANPVATFLFRFAGIGQMDVSASAIFATYQPGCLRQGFTATGIINLQSGSNFMKNFCMHSNAHVKLGNGNTFQTGVTVSMPDIDDLDIGSSGFAQNPGLQEALREDEYPIRILDRIRTGATDPLREALLSTTDDDRPSFITPGSAVIDLGTGGNMTYSSTNAFPQNRVIVRNCNASNRTLTITGPSSGITYKNFVLITNCLINLSGKVTLENVVLYTTNIATDSVKVTTGGGGGNTQGLWIGKPDDCSPTGGAQIVTHGGFSNSAALFMYGAQIISLGPVQFSSNATGEGAAIISDSTINGTSNLNFSGCPTGNEENFTAGYYRMVR